MIPRTNDVIDVLANDYGFRGWRRTGLWKRCPRCCRFGEVFATQEDWFAIVWDGRARGGHAVADVDTVVMPREDSLGLGDPVFGCGYDDHDSGPTPVDMARARNALDALKTAASKGDLGAARDADDTLWSLLRRNP